MEGRKYWIAEDEKRGVSEQSPDSQEMRLFVNSGMLRVQPSDHLEDLEKETLANMERDGFRDKQFVKSILEDQQRADRLGWKNKLLDFAIPGSSPPSSYEAVLDSTAGFLRCSNACAYYQQIAASKGVHFHFGSESGAVESLVKEPSITNPGKSKVIGLKTVNGVTHKADVVVIAGKK